jgi:AraC family L-rhamnose operon transcriptional activator RhaR
MWARRDGLLGPLFDPSRSTAGDRPTTLVDLGPAEVRRVIEVLEPIRTGDAPTRAAQLARLLLALDAIAGAAALERPFGWTADTSPAVTDAVELLSSDLAHPWTLDELSRRVYTGRFHLAHAFARAVGQPPMQYLAGLRAERAAALLSSTDLPIAVVGTEVGWPDPAYFSRRFRAAFGISPRDYRRLRSSAAHEAATAIKDVQEFGKRGQVAV